MIKINEGHIEIEGNAAQIQAELTTLLCALVDNEDPIVSGMVDLSIKRLAKHVEQKIEEAL